VTEKNGHSLGEALPPVLVKHREAIRQMMIGRTNIPGSPIPQALVNRVSDWIMTLVAFRANERHKLGKEPFPDQETLADDISRSAEAVECLFIVAIEEVNESPSVLVVQGNVRETH
jgi:hypothetical protein